MTRHLHSLIPHLANQRIMVIGDIILDEYIMGTATRMSREAPIPVLEFQNRQFIPGGAANPAANIVALGGVAIQVGIIGADEAATNLRQELNTRNIDTDSLVTSAGRHTTVKTRIMAQMGLRFPQQVARVDTLSREPINSRTEAAVLDNLKKRIDEVDAVLFSDYHIGMLTPSLITQVRTMARAARVMLTADTQGFLEKYQRFGLVKCNTDDAQAYLRRELKTNDDFGQAVEELYNKLELTGCMVITRGSDGATIYAENQVQHLPSPSVSDVYDTVGAGDTSIAVMTMGITAGASYADAVTLANYASGIVVRHVGNYTPSPDELKRTLGH